MPDPAALAAALADRYRLERELGEGGMATVYLAQDLRHDRRVAVKVLRPELAAVIGADRFLAEIKTTANLQHPHILPLFDSGVAGARESGDGTFLYYVMPYVEGESVRDRIRREKQLPVADAVRIATEVASALDYAHRHGVIHRDIKPENILLHDGRALVADFGIALAASKAGGTRMTETGMSLGTPYYMSPEQAMGEREITARSDVYALGCVLYELLTGDPPFTGSTAQAIVARVVTESPRPMAPQRHTIPPHVESAVLTALEKLPADRFATAAEFARALEDPGYAPTVATAAHRRADAPTRRRALLPALAALTVLAAALAAWGWLRPAPPRPVLRFSMGLPAGQAMRQGILGVNLAISPDGQRFVYVGPGEGGDVLWVRDRDQLDATPLPGTDGAQSPYFSPDGTRIAFSSGLNSELRVVPTTGGPPITLATPGPGSGGGGAWGPDGWIYFDTPGGLARIPAGGGSPEPLVPLDSASGEIGHAWPAVLPGGRGLLYRSRRNLDPSDFEIVAFDLETRERRVLTRGLMARFVEPGHLVFLRADGAVLAAPFDEERLELTGPAVPLFEGVMVKSFGSADFALSPGGTLVYVPGRSGTASGVAELVYVSREGGVTPLDPPVTYNPSANPALSLSPDGTRLAIDLVQTATSEIWIKQLPAGPLSRLTFDGRAAIRPRWTPDGRTVLYLASPDSGPQAVWRSRADGSTAAELVWRLPDQAINEAVLSRDGQWLVYRVNGAGGNRDIFGVRPGRDTAPTPLLTGPFNEHGAALSPDGRWLAYSSNESGREEVFVRPFPETGTGRWQVSTRGGAAALWARSGRELFFEGADGDFMVVPVPPGAVFAPGEPRRLFALGGTRVGSNVVPLYDLTPDDSRFVAARIAAVDQAPGSGQLVVVENWSEELRAKMGGKK
ncbi:MAG TPA: protein kinase [Gemmatimonadales bacterium]|nr:protein kinase [Gemmatimonadales bacterium]